MSKILTGLVLLQLCISISNHFKLKTIMGSNEDLSQKLTDLQSAVDDVQQKVATKDAQLQTALDAALAAKTALEAELANSINPTQTQAAIAQLDATIADINSTVA